MNIAYCRISKARAKTMAAIKHAHQQDVRVQKTAIDAAAAARGQKIDKFVASECSATKTQEKRGLATVLNGLQPGDVLWAVALDRLARNVGELKNIVSSVRAKGCGLVITNCDFVSFAPGDGTNPQADLIVGLMGCMAEFELSLIRERTARGLAHARAKGKILGCPPEKLRATAEKNKKAADEFAESLRPKVTRLVKRHRDTVQIANALNRAGILSRTGKKWYPSSVSNLLKRLNLK